MQFTFPQNAEVFRNIKTTAELQQLIKEENALMGSNMKYRINIRKQKYLYAKCKFKKCLACLNYCINGDVFQLVKYSNIHNHDEYAVRRGIYSKIEEELNELPLTMSVSAAKYHICSKYRISHRCFYYLFQKVRNKKTTYLALTELLDEKKYEIHSDPYFFGMNELPDLMIVVTPLMKENFGKFGDWMGFDFTFNLIQEVKDRKQPYRVGVFVGISSSKKIVPFGLVVCNEQTKERLYQIFKSFSEIMNKIPNVVITDEDKATVSALKSLKEDRQFDGVHLLDSFHILRNVRKNLVDKDCWTYFNRLIRQRSEDNFNKIVDQCYQALQDEKDIQLLKRFLENSPKYCFSQIPKAMFGFMPNTAMNEKIHDLIKTVLPYSKPFTVTVKKILLYLEELGLKCLDYQLETVKYQDTFFYPQLKEVRYLVCKSIFKEVILQFSKSIHHQIESAREGTYIVKEESKYFKVIKVQESWKCVCNYIQKTGIFCSHLVKVLLAEKLKLSDYVHKRWKMDNQKEKRKSYQYQKKTRRNR